MITAVTLNFTDPDKGELNIVAFMLKVSLLQDILLMDEPYVIYPYDSDKAGVEISKFIIQEYLSYYPGVEKYDDNGIIFFVDFGSSEIISPYSVNYLKLLSFFANKESLDLSSNTLTFYYEKDEYNVSIVKFSLEMLDTVCFSNVPSLEGFIPYISNQELSKYYKDFLNKGYQQEYFLLALDVNTEKPVGYVYEPSPGCPHDQLSLVLVKT